MAKAMGHKLDAVVCDTAATACQAIEYLKAHRHPPVTFLPVDELRGIPSIDTVDRYAYTVLLRYRYCIMHMQARESNK